MGLTKILDGSNLPQAGQGETVIANLTFLEALKRLD
jgi:hypothetical protein